MSERLLIIAGTVALILAIPLIAMQFTYEVDWNLVDFVIAGALLLGIGLLIEYSIRKIKTKKKRLIVCTALVFGLVVVWAELAVGIFGSPFAGS